VCGERTPLWTSCFAHSTRYTGLGHDQHQFQPPIGPPHRPCRRVPFPPVPFPPAALPRRLRRLWLFCPLRLQRPLAPEHLFDRLHPSDPCSETRMPETRRGGKRTWRRGCRGHDNCLPSEAAPPGASLASSQFDKATSIFASLPLPRTTVTRIGALIIRIDRLERSGAANHQASLRQLVPRTWRDRFVDSTTRLQLDIGINRRRIDRWVRLVSSCTQPVDIAVDPWNVARKL